MSDLFSFTWFGALIEYAIKERINKNLEAAAIHLENAIKKELGEKCPHVGNWQEPHSPPGTYPYLETGELRRSVTHTVDKDRMVARVGTNKVYARYLEKGTRKMAARPFLQTTLEKEWSTMRGIITRG